MLILRDAYYGVSEDEELENELRKENQQVAAEESIAFYHSLPVYEVDFY